MEDFLLHVPHPVPPDSLLTAGPGPWSCGRLVAASRWNVESKLRQHARACREASGTWRAPTSSFCCWRWNVRDTKPPGSYLIFYYFLRNCGAQTQAARPRGGERGVCIELTV